MHLTLGTSSQLGCPRQWLLCSSPKGSGGSAVSGLKSRHRRVPRVGLMHCWKAFSLPMPIIRHRHAPLVGLCIAGMPSVCPCLFSGIGMCHLLVRSVRKPSVCPCPYLVLPMKNQLCILGWYLAAGRRNAGYKRSVGVPVWQPHTRWPKYLEKGNLNRMETRVGMLPLFRCQN